MSLFTSFAGQLSADLVGSTTPVITRVAMTTAATEYSYTLPANCRQYMIKLSGSAVLQLAYVSGDSSVNYLTVPRNCFYAESDLKLTSTVTLYFQSNQSSQVAEIVAWS